MKEIIEKSNLKLKEFAEKYEIPYNTVRQWYNGQRKAPEWIKKLIKEKPLDLIKKPDIIIYEYYTKEGLKYRALLSENKSEEQIIWFNSLQKKFKHQEEGLNQRKIYKAYQIYREE